MPFDRRIVQVADLLCLLVCLVGCSSTASTATQRVSNPTALATSAAPTPLVYREPFNQRVDVGGYKLSIKCIGNGSPTVVLDAGLNGTGDTWIKVWPKLKPVTRACIYDRAGLGESERGPMPRTSETIVTELHALLVNAGITGPYVLVGHSFGGYNVRIYASQYPDAVAGMVLVDSTTEDWFTRVQALLPPPTSQECRALAALRNAAIANREGVDLPASTEQVRQAHLTLGTRPLIVLSRGRAQPEPSGCVPASLATQIEQVDQELQGDLAQLSSNSKHTVVANSGHQIQLDQPQSVIDSILEVVQSARTGSHLAS